MINLLTKKIIKDLVLQLHTASLDQNDGEPMDGDKTEQLADYFLFLLNELNGNISNFCEADNCQNLHNKDNAWCTKHRNLFTL